MLPVILLPRHPAVNTESSCVWPLGLHITWHHAVSWTPQRLSLSEKEADGHHQPDQRRPCTCKTGQQHPEPDRHNGHGTRMRLKKKNTLSSFTHMKTRAHWRDMLTQTSHVPNADIRKSKSSGFGFWKRMQTDNMDFRLHEESLCVREEKVCNIKPGSALIRRKCTMWWFVYWWFSNGSRCQKQETLARFILLSSCGLG